MSEWHDLGLKKLKGDVRQSLPSSVSSDDDLNFNVGSLEKIPSDCESQSDGKCVKEEVDAQCQILYATDAKGKRIRRTRILDSHISRLPCASRCLDMHVDENTAQDNKVPFPIRVLNCEEGSAEADDSTCQVGVSKKDNHFNLRSGSKQKADLRAKDMPMIELTDIEVTTKSRVYAAHGKEPYWHVIFGIVNHGCYMVAVKSLSFWSLNGSSEITTIRWGHGEMILKDDTSFLCYGIRSPCYGCYDSPRLGFSWDYHNWPEKSVGRSNEEETSRSSQMLMRRMCVKDPNVKNSLYSNSFRKRLGDLFGWSCKRPKRA